MRAVIFDMDGVLADTEPLYVELNARFLADRGIALADVGYEQYVGISAKTMWSRLREQFHLPETVDWLIAREKATFYEHLCRKNDLPAIAGVEDLLMELRAREVRIALASSSARRNIDLVLEKTGLADFFSVITAGEEVEKGKPAPDIFLLAASRLQVSPDDCLVIEDSRNGVWAAKDAGMTCVGFRNPGSGNQDLARADLVVADFLPASRLEIFRLLAPK